MRYCCVLGTTAVLSSFVEIVQDHKDFRDAATLAVRRRKLCNHPGTTTPVEPSGWHDAEKPAGTAESFVPTLCPDENRTGESTAWNSAKGSFLGRPFCSEPA